MMAEGRSARVSATMPLTLGLCTLVVLLGGLGLWLTQTQIAGAVIADGRIETSSGPHLVSHAAGGIVEHLAVSEGQLVEKGDLLIELETSSLDLLLASSSEQIAELLARRIRLQAERDKMVSLDMNATVLGRHPGDFPGLVARLEFQQAALIEHRARIARETSLQEQRVLQVENQIAGVEASMLSLKEEIDLLKSELDRQNQMLDRGLIQRSSVLALQRELVRNAGELQKLMSQHEELIDKLVEFRISVSGIEDTAAASAQTELDRIEPQLLTLLERHGDLELEKSLRSIYAPISGYVHDQQVLGEKFLLKPGAPILTIISDEAALKAVVRVVPRDIDQVHPGQEVGLQFRSYSRRSVPLLDGIVESVGPDASLDPVTRQSYFEVIVEIPNISAEARLQLVPGMELIALLKTEDETPLEYVSRPIRDYLSLAMRDR
jgi:HlyD family type I secretion membrane fusion protein